MEERIVNLNPDDPKAGPWMLVHEEVIGGVIHRREYLMAVRNDQTFIEAHRFHSETEFLDLKYGHLRRDDTPPPENNPQT